MTVTVVADDGNGYILRGLQMDQQSHVDGAEEGRGPDDQDLDLHGANSNGSSDSSEDEDHVGDGYGSDRSSRIQYRKAGAGRESGSYLTGADGGTRWGMGCDAEAEVRPAHPTGSFAGALLRGASVAATGDSRKRSFGGSGAQSATPKRGRGRPPGARNRATELRGDLAMDPWANPSRSHWQVTDMLTPDTGPPRP
jgi:hypothetical protein